MGSIPLLFFFYKWGKLRYREDSQYPNVTQSAGCGYGIEPSECDALYRYDFLLQGMSYEQCLKETELLCLKRRSHMFTILLALKSDHMEERDKIHFMCCQNVVSLVRVVDREIKGM